MVLDALQQDVMEVLGLSGRIDLRQPLNELGLDSLMSVNLVNRLEATLSISVPVAKLIQGPSLEQLADSLFPELTAPTEVAAATSEIAGDGWLVFPKPAPEAMVRLFCFPFAGGGAAIYRPWAEAVDSRIEIVAIEPPGRASRIHEPPVNSLSAFLGSMVPALLPYLDKPFAFFGHCLGGLTLFEITRALLYRHELQPSHLFVSGARAPHRLLQTGSFEENLLADLLKLDKFDPFLLLHEQPDDVFADIIRHFNIGATEEFLADPELRQLMLPAIRAEFAMTFHYEFHPEAPWDVPITCFSGIDDVYVTREDALAWGQYTNRAFRLYMRDGAHVIVVDDASFILETIDRELIASVLGG